MSETVPSKFLLIIGTAKAGTSSLASWLGSRPDMVLGQSKEPRHLSSLDRIPWEGPAARFYRETHLRDRASYLENYAGKPGADWAIDGSTDYLWCPDSPDMIASFAEKYPVRLICITRDPVDRAVSEYNHTLNAGMETLSFGEALQAEPERIAAHWNPLFHHLRRSRISEDLTRYKARFGDDLLVLDHAALRDPAAVNRQISEFLGIEALPFSSTENQNERSLPRNRTSARLLKARGLAEVGRRLLPPSARAALRAQLERPAREVKTVSEAEIAQLRGLLSDEIAACVANPLIDTSTWKRALAA